MNTRLHLVSSSPPAPDHVRAAAHYGAEAQLATLLADLRTELARADQIMQLALRVMPLQQKNEWARLADAAGLLGPSGGTTRAHERAAVLARAHPAHQPEQL